MRQTALLEERVAEVACCVLAQVLHNAARAAHDPSAFCKLLRQTLSSLVLVLAKHCPGVALDTGTGDSDGGEDEEDEEVHHPRMTHATGLGSSSLF